MEKKTQLRSMFTSSEWEECKWSKNVKGKVAYATVMSIAFWNGVTSRLFAWGVLQEGVTRLSEQNAVAAAERWVGKVYCDLFQLGTTRTYFDPYVGDAGRNVDAGQAKAGCKGLHSDFSDAGGDRNTRQVKAMLERTFSDDPDTVGNRNGCHVVTTAEC